MLKKNSRADPAFCLSFLAHSLLFANNLARNGNDEQKRRFDETKLNRTELS
jgi:hypothetical protein